MNRSLKTGVSLATLAILLALIAGCGGGGGSHNGDLPGLPPGYLTGEVPAGYPYTPTAPDASAPLLQPDVEFYSQKGIDTLEGFLWDVKLRRFHTAANADFVKELRDSLASKGAVRFALRTENNADYRTGNPTRVAFSTPAAGTYTYQFLGKEALTKDTMLDTTISLVDHGTTVTMVVTQSFPEQEVVYTQSAINVTDIDKTAILSSGTPPFASQVDSYLPFNDGQGLALRKVITTTFSSLHPH